MKEGQLRRFVIILLLTAGVSSALAQEVRGPRIEVKQERYDMGSVVQGKPAEHIFEIRNAGTELLVIEGLQPS